MPHASHPAAHGASAATASVPALRLQQLHKQWPDGRAALQQVSLEVAAGEFLVLVGPSGCGKSTLLRLIAGLEEADGGQLDIHGAAALHLPPQARRLALVFQSYALYPHMTVAENLGFALKMARRPKAEIQQRVQEVAQLLQLQDLLKRKPGALSGGQRQRVAIGRALVARPKLLMLDEPSLGLAPKITEEIEEAIIRISASGQRIAVMQGGRIVQCADAATLYDAPVNRFVAGFLGTPQMNFAPAGLAQALCGSAPPAPAQTLGVRAEHLQVQQHSEHSEQQGLAVQLEHAEFLGDCSQLYLRHSDSNSRFCVRHSARSDLARLPGTLYLRAQLADCHFFDAQEQRITV